MDGRGKKAIASSFVVGSLMFAHEAFPQGTDTPIQMSLSNTVTNMQLPHEAIPAGVPPGYSWRMTPVVQSGNRVPPNYRAITGWGQVFLAMGATPDSTRVSIRNFRTYIVLQSGELRLVQSTSTIEGASFNPDYQHNISHPALLNIASDTETIVTVEPGYAFHFWPKAGRVDMEPGTVKGVIVALEARLDQPGDQANINAQKKYVLSMGADYWTSRTSAWNEFKTNAGVAIGRFQYVTRDWRCFTMTTLTQQDAAALARSFEC